MAPSTIGASAASWLRRDAQPLSAEALSRSISFSRITLIVGLVFLHYMQFPNTEVSPFDGMGVGQHRLATFINSFALFFFFSVVPLLSMMSGWLFFSFANPAEAEPMVAIRRRMTRRVRSLYLPLVVWNIAVLVVVGLLFAVDPGHPLLKELNVHFETAGALDLVNAIFGISAHPVAFQFWFVRDLFVTTLISPLLWLTIKRAPLVGMLVLGLAWISGSKLLIFFRTDVPFFFYLGALLRCRGSVLEIGRRQAILLVTAYLALVALRTAAPLLLEIHHHRPIELTAATRAMRLLGVVACWGAFQHIAATRFGEVVARYGGLAFFLHAIHYPLIAEIKILLWHWVPAQTDGWMLLHYVASVTVTVALGLGSGILLARTLPRLFALMNGGRALGVLADGRRSGDLAPAASASSAT